MIQCASCGKPARPPFTADNKIFMCEECAVKEYKASIGYEIDLLRMRRLKPITVNTATA